MRGEYTKINQWFIITVAGGGVIYDWVTLLMVSVGAGVDSKAKNSFLREDRKITRGVRALRCPL